MEKMVLSYIDLSSKWGRARETDLAQCKEFFKNTEDGHLLAPAGSWGNQPSSYSRGFAEMTGRQMQQDNI